MRHFKEKPHKTRAGIGLEHILLILEFVGSLFQIAAFLTARTIVPPLSLGRIKIVEVIAKRGSSAATGEHYVEEEYGHNPIVDGKLIWRWEDAVWAGCAIWIIAIVLIAAAWWLLFE